MSTAYLVITFAVLDNGVLGVVVESGLNEVPCVTAGHLRGRFNDLMHAVDNNQGQFQAAVQLAGIALRYAWENRPRR